MERVRSARAAVPFTHISKLMIFYLVATTMFCFNTFTSYQPGTVLSGTKGPVQLVLGTIVDYEKFSHLHQGKYVQVHK